MISDMVVGKGINTSRWAASALTVTHGWGVEGCYVEGCCVGGWVGRYCAGEGYSPAPPCPSLGGEWYRGGVATTERRIIHRCCCISSVRQIHVGATHFDDRKVLLDTDTVAVHCLV